MANNGPQWLRQVVAEYLGYRMAQKLAKRTLDRDLEVLTEFVSIVTEGHKPRPGIGYEGEDLPPDLTMRAITADVIQRWTVPASRPRHKTQDGNMRASSINLKYSVIRNFILWAHQSAKFPSNTPLPTIGLKDLKVIRRDFLRMEVHNWETLLNLAPNPRDKFLIIAAAFTGLRTRSEITTVLTVGQARESLAKGKLDIFRLKTGAYDKLPMVTELMYFMKEYLDWYESAMEAEGKMLRDEHYLIPRFHGSMRFGQTTTILADLPLSRPDRILKDILMEAGIAEKGDYEASHTFRRSFAYAMYMELKARADLPEGDPDRLPAGSRPIKIVQEMLGHEKEETTWHYIGETPSKADRDAVLTEQRAFRTTFRFALGADDVAPQQTASIERSKKVVTARRLSVVRDVG